MAYTGTTDATGTVTIQVPAGTYTVSDAPPSGYTAAPSQSVTVVAGATVDVKFQVTAPDGTVVASVVDTTGHPVSGVTVTLQ